MTKRRARQPSPEAIEAKADEILPSKKYGAAVKGFMDLGFTREQAVRLLDETLRDTQAKGDA